MNDFGNTMEHAPLIMLPSPETYPMDTLLKVLLTDEKKITQLTLYYKELTKNKDTETNSEKKRRHLLADIAAIKGTNAKIVKHFLNETILSPQEIYKITNGNVAA